MPTIHSLAALKQMSTLKTPSSLRKPFKVLVYENDLIADFREKDKITNFVVITQSQAPANYRFCKTSKCIVL